MAIDRRLPSGLAGWALLLAIPLVVLAWLRLNPEINGSFQTPIHHFFIVTVVQFVSMGIALLVVKAAVELREFRVLFLSLGFLSMCGFFAVHGLATPGLLLPAGQDAGRVTGLSAFLSLLLASLFFAGSATPLPLLIRRRTRGMALAFVVATLVVTAAYGVSVFIWTDKYAQVPLALPWGSYVTAGTTIGLLGLASWRNLTFYSLTRLPMQLALVAGFVLLAEAQVSMAISPLWSLGWWGYHVLMLMGAGAAMAGLLVQYSRTGSLRKIMEGVFALEGLVEMDAGNAETLVALAAATEAGEAPFSKGHTVRVAETAVALGRALHLPKDRLRILARAGLLHDIGKLGVPESVLVEAGSLEPEIGVILTYHERIHASGIVPDPPSEQMSMEAKIIAVADMYDSTVSDRSQAEGLPLQRVRQTLQREAASRLDPLVVKVCLTMMDEGKLPGSGGGKITR